MLDPLLGHPSTPAEMFGAFVCGGGAKYLKHFQIKVLTSKGNSKHGYMVEERGYMAEECSYMAEECRYMAEECGYVGEKRGYMM